MKPKDSDKWIGYALITLVAICVLCGLIFHETDRGSSSVDAGHHARHRTEEGSNA